MTPPGPAGPPFADGVVLGIETSCDETAAALVSGGRDVLSSVVASQAAEHAPFGGIVPEIAARAHLELLNPVIGQALDEAGMSLREVDAVAATSGPGLAAALLVGLAAGKGVALARSIPFVGVNHLEGHLFAILLDHPGFEPPAVALLASGGHTVLIHVEAWGRYRVLGETVDDAAGEAFDKVARILGMGYPGGPAIDRASASGNPEAIALPRAMLADGLDFSFSGLKTAVVLALRRAEEVGEVPAPADVAASFQEAVVDVQVAKLERAVAETGVRRVALAGGVAANSRLRRRVEDAFSGAGVDCYLPSLAYCTDNAAMVAAAGAFRLAADGPSPLDLAADPNAGLAGVARED